MPYDESLNFTPENWLNIWDSYDKVFTHTIYSSKTIIKVMTLLTAQTFSKVWEQTVYCVKCKIKTFQSLLKYLIMILIMLFMSHKMHWT